jgi:hypothetical protein
MHSPIIYISKEDKQTEYTDDFFKENTPSEIELTENILESDWLVPDTQGYDGWHRGSWNIKEIINNLEFMNLTQYNTDLLKITINRYNINDWKKAITDEIKKYSDSVEEYLKKDELVPISLGIKGLDYNCALDNNEFGGIRFCSIGEEGYLEFAMSTYQLLDYAHHSLMNSDEKEVSFIVSTKTQGDYYHF